MTKVLVGHGRMRKGGGNVSGRVMFYSGGSDGPGPYGRIRKGRGSMSESHVFIRGLGRSGTIDKI
jgi:hypothetical protein